MSEKSKILCSVANNSKSVTAAVSQPARGLLRNDLLATEHIGILNRGLLVWERVQRERSEVLTIDHRCLFVGVIFENPLPGLQTN